MPKATKKDKTNKNTKTVGESRVEVIDFVSPKKIVEKKKRKCVYKFNINKILKERETENELNKKIAVIDEKMKVIDELFEAAINSVNEPKLKVIESGYIIFDPSKYNLLFKASDTTNLYLQKLFQMSVEENEIEAVIHFNNLMAADWSPVFDDIQNIFYNWGADSDTFLNRPVMQKIDQEGKIGWHNFEFIMKYISHCINNNNTYISHSDLLTLAKFIVTISFDSHCKEMTYAIKEVFNDCIEKALSADDDDSIIAFAEELYSKCTENELMKVVVGMFLPLEGRTMRKMYCYFSFKLFKSFIGSTDNTNAFPTTVNDWFVQDLVPREYFENNPRRVQCVIILLNHVVFTLNLYENEEKLQIMYYYLYSLARSVRASLGFYNILDQWNLRLLRFKIIRCINNST